MQDQEYPLPIQIKDEIDITVRSHTDPTLEAADNTTTLTTAQTYTSACHSADPSSAVNHGAQCQQCGKIFKYKSQFLVHQTVHTGVINHSD